jgi:hypothetical protein
VQINRVDAMDWICSGQNRELWQALVNYFYDPATYQHHINSYNVITTKVTFSGFGGLGVARFKYPSSRVQTRLKPSGFSRAKIPQRTLLQRGSKAVGPMSQIYGM